MTTGKTLRFIVASLNIQCTNIFTGVLGANHKIVKHPYKRVWMSQKKIIDIFFILLLHNYLIVIVIINVIINIII